MLREAISVNALDEIVNGLFLGRWSIGISLSALVRSFPSVYQLLPTYSCLDLGDGQLRKVRGVDLPNASTVDIDEGLAFHSRIEDAVERHSRYQTFAVKGVDQPTSQSALLRGGKVEPLRSYKGEDKGGDGTVPRPSSHPPEWEEEGASTYVSQKHENHVGFRSLRTLERLPSNATHAGFASSIVSCSSDDGGKIVMNVLPRSRLTRRRLALAWLGSFLVLAALSLSHEARAQSVRLVVDYGDGS
jgi:hypothetical protein